MNWLTWLALVQLLCAESTNQLSKKKKSTDLQRKRKHYHNIYTLSWKSSESCKGNAEIFIRHIKHQRHRFTKGRSFKIKQQKNKLSTTGVLGLIGLMFAIIAFVGYLRYTYNHRTSYNL